MRLRSQVDDLKHAAEMSHAALTRQRRHVLDLSAMNADGVTMEAARTKLAIIEEIHAEDLAKLQRMLIH